MRREFVTKNVAVIKMLLEKPQFDESKKSKGG